MFSVYIGNDLIFSHNATSLGYVLSSAVVTEEVNKAGSLDMTLPVTNPSYSKISKLKPIVSVRQNDEEFWRGRVLEVDRDFYNNKQVFCEGELAFLNDVYTPAYQYSRITVNNFYKTLMDQYNSLCDPDRSIQKGNVTVSFKDEEFTVDMSSESTVLDTFLDQLVNNFGGILRIRRENNVSYLDYVDEDDLVSNQRINFGTNLLDLTEYVDASDIYTCIVPFSKADYNDGQRIGIKETYVQSDTGVNLFGKIFRVVYFENISWQDFISQAGEHTLDQFQEYLKSVAEETVNDSIKENTTIELTAIDLKLLDVDVVRITAGENVPVVSLPHDISENFLCRKVETDLLNPENSNYTFGFEINGITDEQVSSGKTSSEAYDYASSSSNKVDEALGGLSDTYVTRTEYDAFKTQVESDLSVIEDFNPDNYLTVSDAKDMYATKQEVSNLDTVYVNRTEYESLVDRVTELEQKIQNGGIS